MNEFSIGAFEMKEARVSDFNEIISIIKGHSIISAADWGTDRFELGLSGDLMLRFFHTTDGSRINLISTNNKNEIPPLVLSLGDMPKKVSISIIEKKLNGLRTLYAIFYLIQNNRSIELEKYISVYPNGDIESDLLQEDEKLCIESISYGSWLLTVWAKSKKAFKAITSVVGLVFERGREAYLTKLEAEARLKKFRGHLIYWQKLKHLFKFIPLHGSVQWLRLSLITLHKQGIDGNRHFSAIRSSKPI